MGNEITLLSVRGISKKVNDEWKDNYKVEIKVDGIKLDFESDLKDGILKETQKIFSPLEYNFTKFDTMYGREPKKARKPRKSKQYRENKMLLGM